MPENVLYGVISFLGLTVITLVGVYVRANDRHRQWATEKITTHESLIAVMQASHIDLKSDVTEIKETLKGHVNKEERFQLAMVQKFGLKIEP